MFLESKYRDTVEFQAVYEKLKLVAANKGKVFYGSVFSIMKLKPGNYAAKEAGQLLGEISEDAHINGKPMLTAIVINQGTKEPGKGFYDLAVMLGRLAPGANDEDKERFWKLEVNRVH